jgi:hypothetical protein
MADNYKDAWIEQRTNLTQLEQRSEGQTKLAQQIRNKMIQYWNQLTPQQQREIANRYCPE